MKKIKLDDAYFGIKLPSVDGKELETSNLFDNKRVKKSVATYITMKAKGAVIRNPLFFCFGDTWVRCEYEFTVCPWPFDDDEKIIDNGIKVDTWTMYAEPNKDYLMKIVDSISISSARKYLSEERKRCKR